MANDKDFIVKNAVEVGGSTKTTLGTVTNDDIDLSTGNYFAHTPVGATTYTISNAATNQSFQLEVTGGTEEVAQNFSTTLYTGTGSALTINNGIDLSTDGGLVWTKRRNSANSNWFLDTERGGNKIIRSNTTEAEFTSAGLEITSFNTDGYTLGTASDINSASGNDVSWTFKKAAGFFDIVTYTGTGSAQNISHNLGTTVGTLIVKRTDTTGDWLVQHRSLGGTYYMDLQNTNAAATNTTYWNNTTATSTEFTVGTSPYTNASGGTYVAYLFAHDTASDGQIQCGSFTTDASALGSTVDLGWQPQWVLTKETSGVRAWQIHDGVRNSFGGGAYLNPNSTAAENTGNPTINLTDTGFYQTGNGASASYIYVAIRSAADLDLTWPTSIEWAGGATPPAPATGETDIFTISTDDGGTTYQGFKTADNLS